MPEPIIGVLQQPSAATLPYLMPAAEADRQRLPAIIPLRFWTEYKYPPGYDPLAAENVDRNQAYKEEDWVEWVKKGENGGARCQEAIARLAPSPKKSRPATIEWAVIGPAYDAWKRGEEIPTTGTPLYAWAGASKELVTELRKFNIYSIEDLAEFPDHKISQVPLANLRDLRARARAWVEAKSTTDVGASLAVRDKSISELQNVNADLQKQLEELRSSVSSMEGRVTQSQRALSGASADDEFVEVAAGDVPSPAPRQMAKRR